LRRLLAGCSLGSVMPFNPKIDHVLVTDLDSGPKGWEVMPMQDLNVFYDPAKFDETDMIVMTTAYESGKGSRLEKTAYFDTALDREL
jgi:hypothetical protein